MGAISANRAAPCAPRNSGSAAANSCPSSRFSSDPNARTRPGLHAPPPTSTTTGVSARPFTTVARNVRASARQRPYAISAGGVPFCWRWIMSDLANTLQRPAIDAPRAAPAASRPSASTSSPRRDACCSRNAPAPAAHSPLLAKSTTVPRCAASRPSSTHLENWPPRSITVLASGYSSWTPRAVATTSLTVMEGTSEESQWALPVTAILRRSRPPGSRGTRPMRSATTAAGRPRVRPAAVCRILPSAAHSATLIALPPMSMPSSLAGASAVLSRESKRRIAAAPQG